MTILSSKLKRKMPGIFTEALEGHGDTYLSVGKTDHSVYYIESTMVRGTNKHSGKTYCRFQNDKLVSFSWNRGRLRVISKRWEKIRNTNRYQVRFEENTDYVLRGGKYIAKPEMVEVLLEERGKSSLEDLFLSEYPLLRDLPPAKDVTPFLTHSNIQDFTRDFFGPSRYRKDLVRGVARRGWSVDGGMDNLVIAKAFAPMIPTDWIARKFLDAPEPTMYTLSERLTYRSDYGYREIRQMLRTASPKQVRRLWTTETFHTFPDTMRLWREIRKVDSEYRLEDIAFTDWKTLHDQLAIDQRRIHTRNRPVKYKGKGLEVQGRYFAPKALPLDAQNELHPEAMVETVTYEVIGTPDTHTLLQWGTEMGNCIGGYQDDALQGSAFLYAVMKDGKMIANIEMDPAGHLDQVVGKFNRTLDREDHDRIVEIFQQVWPDCAAGNYIGKVRPERERLANGEAFDPRAVRFQWVGNVAAGAGYAVDNYIANYEVAAGGALRHNIVANPFPRQNVVGELGNF